MNRDDANVVVALEKMRNSARRVLEKVPATQLEFSDDGGQLRAELKGGREPAHLTITLHHDLDRRLVSATIAVDGHEPYLVPPVEIRSPPEDGWGKIAHNLERQLQEVVVRVARSGSVDGADRDW